MRKVKLSVAIPLHNEEKNVPVLYQRLKTVLNKIEKDHEIVIIDDGSTDQTLDTLITIAKKDPKVKIASLSRNFGYEIAVSAALDHATGQIVVLMDGDMQDSPEFIPVLLAKLAEGYDVAYAQHSQRHDPIFRKTLFKLFYLVLDKISSYPVPVNAGSFSAIRRPVVAAICQMAEQNRYVAGLRAWVGFKQAAVEYEKQPRFAGRPPQTLQKLFRMGTDALFSFSYVPLRLATYLGVAVSIFAFVVILDVLYAKLIAGTAILGWASPLISTLFLGGVQLLILGIIGEYLGRIYDEVKKRPHYIVSQKIGFT